MFSCNQRFSHEGAGGGGKAQAQAVSGPQRCRFDQLGVLAAQLEKFRLRGVQPAGVSHPPHAVVSCANPGQHCDPNALRGLFRCGSAGAYVLRRGAGQDAPIAASVVGAFSPIRGELCSVNFGDAKMPALDPEESGKKFVELVRQALTIFPKGYRVACTVVRADGIELLTQAGFRWSNNPENPKIVRYRHIQGGESGQPTAVNNRAECTIQPLSSADLGDAFALLRGIGEGVALRNYEDERNYRIALDKPAALFKGWVARKDNKVVGVVFAAANPFGGVEVQHLAVDAAYRQQGIGSALVKQLLADFSGYSVGLSVACVADDSKMRSVQSFWNELGFEADPRPRMTIDL